jgi:serine/threonine protein phosphatase PrpC
MGKEKLVPGDFDPDMTIPPQESAEILQWVSGVEFSENPYESGAAVSRHGNHLKVFGRVDQEVDNRFLVEIAGQDSVCSSIDEETGLGFQILADGYSAKGEYASSDSVRAVADQLFSSETPTSEQEAEQQIVDAIKAVAEGDWPKTTTLLVARYWQDEKGVKLTYSTIGDSVVARISHADEDPTIDQENLIVNANSNFVTTGLLFALDESLADEDDVQPFIVGKDLITQPAVKRFIIGATEAHQNIASGEKAAQEMLRLAGELVEAGIDGFEDRLEENGIEQLIAAEVFGDDELHAEMRQRGNALYTSVEELDAYSEDDIRSTINTIELTADQVVLLMSDGVSDNLSMGEILNTWQAGRVDATRDEAVVWTAADPDRDRLSPHKPDDITLLSYRGPETHDYDEAPETESWLIGVDLHSVHNRPED